MYTWDPKIYSSNSSAQKNWGHELLAKLDFKGNEKVLDVGCGDGKLSAEIARNLSEGSVLGIDLSEEMIDFARNNYPQDKFPNLTFMQMDASGLTFDSEFDVVFSNAALHWIKAPQAALRGIRRSLKPGGVLLAQFDGKGNVAEVLKIVYSMLKEEKWSPYFRDFIPASGFYGPEEYGRWLKNAGFSIKRLEMITKDMVLEGEKGVSGWIASTWHPYTQHVPAELKANFIDELVTLIINNNPPDDIGNVHIKMKRLEIEAYS
jgi:trans-aconitate methyltransferase